MSQDREEKVVDTPSYDKGKMKEIVSSLSEDECSEFFITVCVALRHQLPITLGVEVAPREVVEEGPFKDAILELCDAHPDLMSKVFQENLAYPKMGRKRKMRKAMRLFPKRDQKA